jgi:predicted AlkP superfamily phosphohydrolase/phosphomutase/tetratricopeptide (TPR) repeat protein
MKKNKVLLVGWDAADWKIIDKLMANGMMPAMKSLVDGGVRGRLATLDPPLSPMLWTSMATGVRPYRHGVLGFVEPDGKGSVRPVSSHSRKVKAIWNIFTMEGIKSNIVGWWPSNPVESIDGCMVSNLFQQEKKGRETIELSDWKIPEGSVYPERIISKLEDLRVHPHEITGNLVMPFVPQALVLDKKKDKRLTVISKFLAHATTLHAATTELMQTEPWDFTAVYHDAIDHFSHAFMKFHPPKMEGMEQEAYDLFKDVVIGAYVYHDMMLERLLNLIDDETTVIVISDHGFHSDHLRPTHIPQVPSGPAIEHAPYGIFVAKGPGIKKGERVHGATILDVTPTLLTLFDLPIGRDMDGKPILEMYDHPKEVKYIDSWESVDKFGGELVVTADSGENVNEAALQQLIDLGYIDDMQLSEDSVETDNYLKGVIRENNFYLAKSYSNGGKYEDALELLLEIENREKPDFRYLIEIVNCAVKTKRFKLAEEYLHYIRVNDLITENYVDVMEAKVQIGLCEPVKATALLKRALSNTPDAIEILLELGRILNSTGKYKEARDCFKKVIDKDPGNPYANHGIGLSLLREENYEEAAEYFLDTIEQLYHFPSAHLHLAESLALMKEYDAAIESFEVVRAIAPELPRAYRWLLDLYEITGNTEKVELFKKLTARFNLGEKLIVTGLPGLNLEKVIQDIKESGFAVSGETSELLGEGINPMEPKWFDAYTEHVCFVPINFIPSLNAKYSYRFLFVEEDVDNITEWVHAKNQIKSETYNPDLVKSLLKQEQVARTWMSQQPNIDVLYISGNEELKTDLVRKYIS